MGYNMSSDIALGQLGSGHLGDAGAFTPPAGKVVVAITCIQDTSFSVLLPEAITDATFKGPIDNGNGAGGAGAFGGTLATPVAEVTSFGVATPTGANGTNSDTVATSDVFPKGITLYGRWKAVTINTSTTATSQVIVYYGY